MSFNKTKTKTKKKRLVSKTRTRKTNAKIGGYFGESNNMDCKNKELSKAAISGINIYVQEQLALLLSTSPYKDMINALTLNIYNNAFMTYINKLTSDIIKEFNIEPHKLNKFLDIFKINGTDTSFLHLFDKMYSYTKGNVLLTVLIYNEIEPNSGLKNMLITPFHQNPLLNNRKENGEVQSILKKNFDEAKQTYMSMTKAEWYDYMIGIVPGHDKYKLYRTIWTIYTAYDYDYPFLKQKRCVTDNLCFSNIKNTTVLDFENKYLLDYNSRMTDDENAMINAFNYTSKLPVEFTGSVVNKNLSDFKYVGSDLIQKDIGSLVSNVSKNTPYYKHFYENGFVVKSGLSGTLPYIESLYLSIANGLNINDYTFYFLYASYMLIRTDHSLIELLVSLPIKELSDKFKTTFNIANINEFTQENVWGLIGHICSKVNTNLKDSNEGDIEPIINLLNDRDVFIKDVVCRAD